MNKIIFYLLIICFASSALGFFSLLPFGGDSLKLYLFDVAALGFVILGSLLLLNSRLKIELSWFSVVNISFLFLASLSLFVNAVNLNTNQLLVSSSYLVRLGIYYLLALIAYTYFKHYKDLVPKVQVLMLASVLFVSLAGFVQLVVLPDFRLLPKEQGWDPHINRLASTFFDPNFTGGFIVLGLSLGLFKLYNSKELNVILLAYVFITALALILTFSRSSWFMFSIVILILGVFKSRKLLVLTLILAFLTYYLIPRAQTRLSGITDPADSAAYRLISWTNAIELSQKNLVFGVGYNAYRYAQEAGGYFSYKDETGGNSGAGADSSLLLVLATTGVIGFFVFAMGYGSLIYSSFINWRRTNNYISGALFASLVSLLGHSQFVNSIFYPQFLLWFAVLIALEGASFSQKTKLTSS